MRWWIFQEDNESGSDTEKVDNHLVKSVLQSKLQKLAILIGYFGMSDCTSFIKVYRVGQKK